MRPFISRAARSRIALVAASTLATVLASTASAQLYWDADGSATGNDITTGANLGGSGTWGSAANWYNGFGERPWPGGDAVFTGSAGTVTLGFPQSASSLAFKSNGYLVAGSTITMSQSPATFSVDPGVSATISSVLAGSANMVKSGGGTLILSNPFNTNTATTTVGGWIINGGTLRIAGDQSLGAPLPDTARNTVTDIQLNQSTIQFANDFEVSINRRTKLNTNAAANLGDAIMDTNGHNVTWYGSIQGSYGSLHVTGGGRFVLGVDHQATVSPFGELLPAGAVNLTVSNNTVLQTAGTATPDGGELGREVNDNGERLAILLESGGQIRSESHGYHFYRNLILGTGGGSLDTGSWDQTFHQNKISGSGHLTKYGSGTLTFDNFSATWTGGTDIRGGTLRLGANDAFGLLPGTLARPGNVSIEDGATLEFHRSSDQSFFDFLTGPGNVLITNSPGSVVRLVCDNNYTGLTTISSGTLMIGQGNQGDPGSIVSDVQNNSVLDFNRYENISYGGIISGAGSVIKEGAGKLTLTAASSYVGGTSVWSGTLIAANTIGSATGAGAVDVSGGAVIAGAGTIGGLLKLHANAHLAPGTSIGTLTAGSLALDLGSILDFELGSPASSDLMLVTSSGGLTINGGVLNVTAASGFGPGQYPIFDYLDSFGGSIANLSIGSAPPDFNYAFINNTAQSSIDLVVSVPEPATILLLPLTLIPLLSRSRKRRAGPSSC